MGGFILLVILIGVVIFLFKFSRNKKRQRLIIEAESYIQKIKSEKSLLMITSHLLLQSNETAFLEERSQLLETRAVRESKGGFGGIRIMKGVTVGRYAGKSESHQEWRVIDSGSLTLTNKKITFDGSKGNRNLSLADIVGCEATLSSIRISLDGKSKDVEFPVKNPYIWASLIQIIRSVKNPLNLEGESLNIELR